MSEDVQLEHRIVGLGPDSTRMAGHCNSDLEGQHGLLGGEYTFMRLESSHF